MNRPAPLPGYSTAEVARLLDLPAARVRAWVRAGFLRPRRGSRGYVFSFQDLVLLRAARSLMAARIPARRVRRALARLREQLPRGRPLAAVALSAEGGEIIVRDGGQAWEPVSGQRVLDFEVAELVQRVEPLARRAAEEARERAAELSAEAWYELGYELEATSPREAREAYARAVDLEPGHADAHLNLGRLLHEEGRVGEAEGHYRRAAELRPEDVTAIFNLGVALEDQGRLTDALATYGRALTADPACADAHYNLAGVLERRGDRAGALRHLKRYKALKEGKGVSPPGSAPSGAAPPR